MTIKGDVQGQPFEQSVKSSCRPRTMRIRKSNGCGPGNASTNCWRRPVSVARSVRSTEIVRLCEDFSIASEYASFIVLENDAEYQRWKIDRKNVSRLERDRTAQARVREQLDALRNEALSKLGPATDGARPTADVASRPAGQPLDLVNSGQAPGVPMPAAPFAPNRPANRGFDLDLPTGGGGGGAIDPISAAIGLGVAGASALAARRRKASQEEVAV